MLRGPDSYLTHRLLALGIEVVSYEESSDGHAHLLVDKIYALAPPFSLSGYPEKNFFELCSFLTVLAVQEGKHVLDQAPEGVVMDGPAGVHRHHISTY
ncbi:hypothetical protein TNCV_1629311 [Trichonephila clavipes]|uniref:Uncharacterized protein n=1 Tax=Trichonephila clavipes TaxID=2585209 RepID=A0A8X6WAF3_TRICX|nr:hypothetical protein TNCV_1629311 [Trichonephila clavipes]